MDRTRLLSLVVMACVVVSTAASVEGRGSSANSYRAPSPPPPPPPMQRPAPSYPQQPNNAFGGTQKSPPSSGTPANNNAFRNSGTSNPSRPPTNDHSSVFHKPANEPVKSSGGSGGTAMSGAKGGKPAGPGVSDKFKAAAAHPGQQSAGGGAGGSGGGDKPPASRLSDKFNNAANPAQKSTASATGNAGPGRLDKVVAKTPDDKNSPKRPEGKGAWGKDCKDGPTKANLGQGKGDCLKNKFNNPGQPGTPAPRLEVRDYNPPPAPRP